MSRWDKFERAKVVKKHTHTRAISFHDTFARKRTRTNRSNAFYRSFAFAKLFHIANAFAAVWRELFFSRQKKKIFQNPSFSETKPNQTHASAERVQRAQRESTQRERERERKREQHAPVDLRAVCFVRAMLTFEDSFFFNDDSFSFL